MFPFFDISDVALAFCIPRVARGNAMLDTSHEAGETRTVSIPASVLLSGDLTIPAGATSIVVFAQGCGCSRISPRNVRLASVLQAGGIATLLFDFLTASEEELDARTGNLRLDVALLAERLRETTDWLATLDETRSLHVGYFGANTGAAGALIAAASRPAVVRAVVSRGGRPDLAGPYLSRVSAPTLFIVGGDDTPIVEPNRVALRQVGSRTKELLIIPGATHLFQERGTLDHVGAVALGWFARHLT
jgi:putative phosphoribosyl transferase